MLSGLSQSPGWKCKYWILSGDSLYYYSSGRDAAAGVIPLSQVMTMTLCDLTSISGCRSETVWRLGQVSVAS